MLEAERVIEALERERGAGATRDRLLREAVQRIQAAEPHYHWVGIYLLEGDTLVLHNYIGRETEHTRIPVGTGVCGTAVAEGRDLNVPDVHAVDNYLACSLETAAELVVLIRDPASGVIHGQLDLDSDRRAAFTERDERELKRVADWLAGLFDTE
ncbi:MAG: GAF domain-containing protein [Gemmatimonadota bacterium]